MSFLSWWHEGWTAALVNHLWQSTAVVVIAWALAAALRKNHARVRYWVWFAASVKFLLPFSLLIAAGGWLRSLVPVPAAQPAVASVMEQVTQPFGQTQFFDAGSAPIAAVHHASYWPAVLVAVWLCGALFLAIRFGLAWAKMNAVKRRARPFALAADVPVLSSSAPIEPGIFGVIRPVLLLPEGIPERLSAEQMRAIVAHEMCHVRRRDNLTFAIHMVVETLFWFHPMVWWIGLRLIEEREHACDQSVVQMGSKAQVYAEGILNVCKFYVETPLNCVSGVTGADLKKRIVRIMTEQVARRLSLSRMLLLGAAAALALTMPVVLGVVRAEAKTNARPSFEVATIKPVDPHARTIEVGLDVDPGGTVRLNGLSLKAMIEVAFDASYWQIEGGEKGDDAWMSKERYNVVAKPPEAIRETMPDTRHTLFSIQDDRLRQMLQTLLIERFQLKVHRETSTGKVYLLERSGKTLRLKPIEAAAVKASPYGNLGEIGWAEGWSLYNETMPELAKFATDFEMHRPVLDRTGLTGGFNYRSAHEDFDTYRIDPHGSFLRLMNELGLKLVPATGPVEMLVIDHAERPSPN